VIQVVQIPAIVPYEEVIFNIILGSIIVNEILGPILARIAFKKVGEIQKDVI
jgi:hypothetical protein